MERRLVLLLGAQIPHSLTGKLLDMLGSQLRSQLLQEAF